MHPGNWIAFFVLCLLVGAIAVAVARGRREAGPRRHEPNPKGDPKPDAEALIVIGKVASDGARSASG
jgi:hypothetical protein